MLTARNITKSIKIDNKEQKILSNISMEIGKQEFVSITGRSGSGKTTLLHVLSTLTKPDEGTLIYDQQEISALPDHTLNKLRKTDFAIIFQFHHLFPYLTALENCLLPFMDSFKPVTKETMDMARESLARVGLSHKENELPSKLSGGEQQRIAIARGLVKSSKVLFADEPTGSLDKKTGEQIMDLLCSLNEDGLTIIMVTHEPSYASRSNRIINIEDGIII